MNSNFHLSLSIQLKVKVTLFAYSGEQLFCMHGITVTKKTTTHNNIKLYTWGKPLSKLQTASGYPPELAL